MKIKEIQIIKDDINIFHLELRSGDHKFVAPVFSGKISRCTLELINHSLKLLLERVDE